MSSRDKAHQELRELVRQAVDGCAASDEVWLGFSWVKAAQRVLAELERLDAGRVEGSISGPGTWIHEQAKRGGSR